MTVRKPIFVESSGLYSESSGMYETSDFINTSAGAADAGKPIVLDADGHIDASMINDGDIDHGSLSGLSDDDHTQYILVNGTRPFTGPQSMGGFQLTSLAAGTLSGDAVNLAQLQLVEEMIKKFEWQPSVIDADTLTPPGSPAIGDRYLIDGIGAGAFLGHDNEIAEYTAIGWTFIVPTLGMFVSADDEPSLLYYYGGSAWSQKYFEATTASTGLTKVGFDIRLDASAAGAGLGFLTGVLSVNVDNQTIEIDTDTLRVKDLGITAAKINSDVAGEGLVKNGTSGALDVNVDGLTLEINTDVVRVKADGINDTHIDFGVGVNQVNAADVPIIDASSYFAATDVEGALSELYEQIVFDGVKYTVGAAGVTKGDLVYISANNTVLSLNPISTGARGIGLALTTEASASTVTVLANDTVISGVLSGATAGVPYYWTGTGLSTSMPTGGGAYVWECGVAKNATDLHVDIRFVKRNA